MITLGHEVLFACLFVFLAVHKILVEIESVTIESALNVMKYCIAFLIHVKLKTKQWLLIILYLLIGFILAVIAGNVGSTPWMPTPVQGIY